MNTTPSLTMREAAEDDLPALARLYETSGIDDAGRNDAASLRSAWSRLRDEAPTARVLLAERGGVPVGTLTLHLLPVLGHGGTSAALVEMVAVDPAAQGQGVGRALMDEAMARARAAGCYKLALSSDTIRDEAHRFYDRLGYRRHGVSFVAHPAAEAA